MMYYIEYTSINFVTLKQLKFPLTTPVPRAKKIWLTFPTMDWYLAPTISTLNVKDS